eukprot:1136984-Pelagomonas_calceolata.AAC.5
MNWVADGCEGVRQEGCKNVLLALKLLGVGYQASVSCASASACVHAHVHVCRQVCHVQNVGLKAYDSTHTPSYVRATRHAGVCETLTPIFVSGSADIKRKARGSLRKEDPLDGAELHSMIRNPTGR